MRKSGAWYTYEGDQGQEYAICAGQGRICVIFVELFVVLTPRESCASPATTYEGDQGQEYAICAGQGRICVRDREVL